MTSVHIDDVVAISRRDGDGYGDRHDWWICRKGHDPDRATASQVSELFDTGRTALT